MRFFDVAKKISSVVILSLFVFSIFENLTYAQTATPASKLDCTKEYCALTTIPGAFDACKVNKNGVVTCDEGPIKNPVSVIKNIYGISIGIGAMLAIVMIIWAGIEYATTEAIYGKSAAKEKWQGAVFGLVLLLASYIILRTINVDLVNINLDLGTPKSACKDKDGKDILDANEKSTCVDSNALGKFLDTINKNASDAIKTTQTAKQNVVEVQKNVTDLQAKLNSTNENLKKIANQASPEARVLTTEAVNIQKQLDEAKHEVKKAEIFAQLSIVNASSAKGFSDIAKALDANDITGARSMKISMNEILNREIETLKKSGASINDVNKATAVKIATDGLINQQIYTTDQIKKIKDSYIAPVLPQKDLPAISVIDQQKIIVARQNLVTQFSTTEVQIRAKDPSQLDSFRQQTLIQQQIFDSKVAQIVNCSKGINVTSSTVTCKN